MGKKSEVITLTNNGICFSNKQGETPILTLTSNNAIVLNKKGEKILDLKENFNKNA